ncbi:MAG: c-type cytochrome [Anaerolineales bacterium]|nr:c-type cytochrome [Anaerolineales bacterium]
MIDSRILVGLIAVLISISGIVYVGIGEADRRAEFTRAFQGRSIESGAALYTEYCVECHGENGEGGIGPNINSKYFFEQRLADIGYQGSMKAFLTLTVRGGRPVMSDPNYGRNMPTWSVDYGGPLRNDQIDTIVSYIMNWQANAPDLGDPNAEPTPVPGDSPEERGKNLFTGMGCVGCHTFGSQTGAVVGPNLTTVYADKGEDHVRQSVLEPNAVITEGYQSNIMPQNFGERLVGPTDLDDLIAYLATGGQ